MKVLPLLFLLSVPIALTAAEVRPGDSLTSVRATLGVPRGQVTAADRLLLYFDRGEVVLQSGIVTRVSLLSDEEHAAREVRRAAIAERVKEETATQTAVGEALKARQLASAAFRNAPLAYQVSFWEDFARRYPGVSCAEPLTIARVSLAEQLEEKRARAEQEARLAELEARVVAAEARASQVAYYTRPYRTYSRGYDAAPALWPINYQMYDSPILTTSSPGMPPIVPTYQGRPLVTGSSDWDWHDGSRQDRRTDRNCAPDREGRRFNPRNRY